MEKLFALLFVHFVLVNTQDTLEKGGYNVLVAFSQNVNPRDGRMLLRDLQGTIADASGVLDSAIGRRFTRVTITVPYSWDSSEWNITTDNSVNTRNQKPDFLIDSTNDVLFGKFPYAQQYGGCGIPGHQIVIPTAFFTGANKFPKGVALAREWLKYRYGVFDENGYEDDPLYPLYNIIPGNSPSELKITECTNAQVKYVLKDQFGIACSETDPLSIDRLNSKECHITPDKDSLENVTSSLMYFQQDIFGMKHICGKDSDHEHNAFSPNKHNAMCEGKSIWDIVKTSGDFQNKDEDSGEIKYVFVKEMKPKVVVAWENTAKIAKIKGQIILNSIKRFIYDLPSGSKFSGFPFSDTLSDQKDYSLKNLKVLSEKNNVMPNIKSDFVKPVDADINIALSKALDILSSGSPYPETEGTVIVIAKSSGTPDNTLLDVLRSSKVCVILLYLSEEAVPDDLNNYVSASLCGSLIDVPFADNEEDMFNKLFAVMEAILPATVDDKATETVKTGYLSNEAIMSFEVDDSVETVTFWIFTDKESENFELKFNGKSEKFKEISTTGTMALSFSPSESGGIEFAYPHITDPIFTQITLTSKAGKYFKVEVFTHDTSEDVSPVQMPVIIYAVIRYGSYPVQKAKVTATVERPNAVSVSFDMYDNGKGDPDITENDGIYSRYFTQFNEKGEYKVTVNVEGDGDLTSYGMDGSAGYQSCCGSSLKLTSSKVSISPRKYSTTFTARSGRPDDGYKPSRVLDLRVDNVTDDKIILKWTAPGGEGDSGTASRYGIKFFGKDEKSDMNKLAKVMNEPSPLSYGQKQEVTIQISNRLSAVFVSIEVYNEKNKTSGSSNIVQVTEPSEIADEANEFHRRIIPRYFIGTVVGSTLIGIMIMVSIIAVVICYLQKKSMYRKQSQIETAANQNINKVTTAFKTTRPSVKAGPVKRTESFKVLLYTHDQIKDCKDRETDPPLQVDGGTPPQSCTSSDAIINLQIGGCYEPSKSSASSSTATDESEMADMKQSHY